jgi:hypothetical protein
MDEDKSGMYRLKNLGILILEFPRPAEPVPELPPKLAVLCCRGTEMCGFILTVRQTFEATAQFLRGSYFVRNSSC